jgi:uncharacterized protein
MGLAFFITAFSLLSVTIYTVYLFLSVLCSKKLTKALIFFVLILFTFGFIITLALSHSAANPIIHWLYVIFSLGIGLLFYLTIFAILFQISKLFKVNKLLFVRISTSLAIILFTIGLYQAAFPVVKNISVNMNGLPSYWHGKKIIQLSDVHLGGVYSLGFFSKQVATVNALKPDLIVITGDLFDGTENELETFGPELAKLKATNGVIFIPGNHDSYLGLEKIEPILATAHITILRDAAVTISGLEIIGLDIHQLTQEDTNLSITNLSSYAGQARLLLKHVPKDISWAKYLNIDLQLSGHSHNGQMFPLSGLTYLIYGKYQYGLHTDGNYNIYTSSGLGSWGPPVRTFNPAEIVNITLN